MPAKDLGNRFLCFKCSTKFYDMKKPDPICPKCGADQRESPALKPQPEGGRRSRLAAAPKVIEPTEPEEREPSEEEEENLEGFDEDESEGETPAAEEEEV